MKFQKILKLFKNSGRDFSIVVVLIINVGENLAGWQLGSLAARQLGSLALGIVRERF
jgi:hypothetical protein